MSRRIIWLQLLVGWLPFWALFTTLVLTNHPNVSLGTASFISLRMIIAAAIVGLGVQRLTEKFPWPTPIRPGFVVLHVIAAMVYSLTWVVVNSIIESIVRGGLVVVIGIGLSSFLTVGIWLYVMVAGVSYTLQSNARAAKAEATAAQAQLAALRSQLNPHFLFNALHTVVQLIPREPKIAAQAAEQVAGLLRTTLEEDRDVIPLSRELDFVERYLEVEAIRFGERLRVHIRVSDEARDATLPSFALQTLIENSVRHGAAPKVEPTDITIEGSVRNKSLSVIVSDTGAGYAEPTGGTGLKRLRDRLQALYGEAARLDISGNEEGTRVTLVIPQESVDQ
jgi:LytS/YehU family sensor histidine kinase